jgi:hypothetical protein
MHVIGENRRFLSFLASTRAEPHLSQHGMLVRL